MSQEWTGEKLLKITGMFLKPRILITAAQLDLFSILKKGPRDVESMCHEKGWDFRALTILMDALAAMEIISKRRDGQYYMEPSVAALLSKDGTGSVLPMVLHRGSMWESWSRLTEIVRSGRAESIKEVDAKSDEDMESFIGAMHIVGRGLAKKVAASIDLSPFSRMLDVGGGSGVYTMAFLRAAPHMTATLFDLPRVVGIAETKFTEEGLIDRVELVPGDYNTDKFPGGQDLVLLSAIIHINSREGNRALFKRVFESLNPRGCIIIRDYLMDDSRISPVEGAIFAVNMLAGTPEGNTYTFNEVREDLEATGFENIRMILEGSDRMNQVLAADKLS
jgi:predicted O-methyltransferase YrrM